MFKLILGASLCAVTLASTSAQAGIRTYISRTGNDANPCTSPAAPCATFQRGINTAGAKGEVYCLDSGFFGVMNISFSVSVMCEDYHGQVGINKIDVSIGANDVVTLNGISMDHRDLPLSSGIEFTGAGTLIVRNSSIRFPVNGISFAPSGAGKLFIENVAIEGDSGVGLLVQPSGTGSATVVVDGLHAIGNAGGGVNLVALTSANSVQAEIRNSIISGNGNFGVRSRSGGNGVSSVLVESSSVSNNVGVGLISRGTNSRLLVSKSAITGNQTGMSFTDGGALLSYGNNNVANLTAAGGPSGTIGLQ